MREPTDTDLLLALAAHGDWATADEIARGFREHVYDPPRVTLVGRRLSRLYHEGKCERIIYAGAGIYRTLGHE